MLRQRKLVDRKSSASHESPSPGSGSRYGSAWTWAGVQVEQVLGRPTADLGWTQEVVQKLGNLSLPDPGIATLPSKHISKQLTNTIEVFYRMHAWPAHTNGFIQIWQRWLRKIWLCFVAKSNLCYFCSTLDWFHQNRLDHWKIYKKCLPTFKWNASD